MRFLVRPVDGPAILRNFNHQNDDWDTLSSAHKRLIWVELKKMQGNLCAYCERRIDFKKEGDKHIEHFLRKGIHPHLTFAWENLFGSCGEKQRCGFFKDKQDYSESDLLKMDELNPELYFRFFYNGDVEIRPNIGPRMSHVAQVTLKVFNLKPNAGGVRAERNAAINRGIKSIKIYANIARQLIEEGADVADARDLVRDEYYESIKNHEFLTAHKHVFEDFLA